MKPAEVSIIKNTNKNAKITYTFKDYKGNIVSEATEPGVYTVTATAAATRKYRITTSNEVTFRIRE